MAKIWTDGFNTYETEEEARDQAMSEITWDDIEEYFKDNISFHDLFEWARKQAPEEFFIRFEDEFCGADNKYFLDNYWEDEYEEEDE